MQIDFYTTVVDNYGDSGFSFNLAISLIYYYPDIKIRYFCDNKNLFLKLKGSENIKNICYYDLGEVKNSKPGDIIFNFFDKKIDFEYLHSFNYEIKLINFTYFSIHPGVESLHNTNYKSQNINITIFVPSILEKTGGVIINPFIKKFKSEINKKNIFNKRKEFLPNLKDELYNKKWVSIFCYKETFEEIKKEFKNNKDYLFFIFDNKIDGENIINMPFLDMNNYFKFLNLCDKNIVRGENSLVEGILSKKPFLWDIYKENNFAHTEKINYFGEFLQLNSNDFGCYIKFLKDFNLGNKKKGFNNFLKANDKDLNIKKIKINNLILNLKKFV